MTYNAILTIHEDIIVENYQTIKKQVGDVPVAVMLKANAYGCGINKIFNILNKQGVKNFFVADLDEAIEVKESIVKNNVNIYILHDIGEDNYQQILDNNFIPVLNTVNNIKFWLEKGRGCPCVIHFDSGINRLGITYDEVVELQKEGVFEKLNIQYVMSHFSSSSTDDKYTEWQYNNFEKVMPMFPKGTKFSIANSGAIFKDKKYHLGLVRTGSALHGINPNKKEKNPFKNAIEVQAKILQIKDVKKGDKIGYNQTYSMPCDGKIAVIGVGYADSILRSHGNTGCFYYGETKLPIIGAVSMDLATVDISAVKEKIEEGDLVEILGIHQDLDAFGADGGTSGYEILTSLSKRYIITD